MADPKTPAEWMAGASEVRGIAERDSVVDSGFCRCSSELSFKTPSDDYNIHEMLKLKDPPNNTDANS